MALNMTGSMEEESEDPRLSFSTNIFEYKWPLGNPESPTYILQEQIAEYLEIRGFSRKYPDLTRRQVEVEEREFLVELGIVTETQSNLGLVALQSLEVYQVMFEDYPNKFKQYMEVLDQRYFLQLVENMKAEKQDLAEKQSQRKHNHSVEMCLLAADFNQKFNERRRKRKFIYDYQTKIYHTAKHGAVGCSVNDPSSKACRNMYPSIIVPGQYSSYVPTFSAQNLRCLPISTVVDIPSPLPTLEATPYIENPPISLPPKRTPDIYEVYDNVESSTDILMDKPSAFSQTATVPSEHDFTRKSVLDKVQRVVALCSICRKGKAANSTGIPEELIQCSRCHCKNHPSCLGIASTCISSITLYPWECNDCKLCWICKKTENEDQVILCDECDRGYHSFCVGLEDIPSGQWLCDICS